MIRLNVGGVIYTSSRVTLCKYPDSMLGAMFGGTFDSTYDNTGCVFIDRDGEMFRHVLNFLRSSRLMLPQKFNDFDFLESEADFYQIQPLLEALHERRQERNEIVRLNVGGKIFTTSWSTLYRYLESMLGQLFGGKSKVTNDDSGSVFIERDGKMFRHVLNFLRSGKLLLPQKFENYDLLKSEANFYQI